ncbi:hypothetical protein NQZ68_030533 [Dissostichus eleginoides]|nr:hypothetical protein NQZ68_030533 [Dissostichus eleginoides]
MELHLEGLKPDGNVARAADRLWTLGRLATRRLVLLNWKERKPACFTRDSWLREYLDLLNMERAASLLGDFEARQEDYGKGNYKDSGIHHSLDIWHGSKNLGKKVLTISHCPDIVPDPSCKAQDPLLQNVNFHVWKA